MRLLTVLIVTAAALGLAVWLGAPPLAKAFGLHPDYEGPRYQAEGKRALIVTTSHPTLGDGGRPTGVFASEMTAPYYAFLDGGMAVDIASIDGGEIPIDPQSFIWFIRADSDDRYLDDPEFQANVANSLPIADVDIARYDIVFLAGGWGAAYDLGQSDALGEKITQAWAQGKIVGGVCHGPLGLLKARDERGAPLVEGRRITAVSDKQVRELGITETPMHPERDLRAAGAAYEASTAFRDFLASHVTVDGRLVTGQNQNDGTAVAQAMMEQLQD